MMENLEDIKKYSVNGIIVSDPNTSEYRRGSIYFVNAKPSLSFCTIFCSQLVNTYFDKRRLAKLILYFGSFIAYNAYVMEAVRLSWNNDDKGKDVRLLVTLTFIAYATVIYYGLLRKRVLRNTWRNLKKKLRTTNYLTPFLAKLTWCVLYGILLGFIISDARGQHLRLVSMAGLLSILVFGYIFSFNRSKIKWHPVIWGIFIQYVIGLVTLRWKFGQGILRFVDIKVLEFLGYTDYGSSAVYGYLVNGELTEVATSDYVFVYKNLSVIIMVSVCTSVLYHYGIMQNVIMKVGWLLEKTMDTTCCESMAAAANIILTMPEACLTIKPYMGIMTMSEIHAVLTSGFSTIACNVFVAYVRLGARADYLMVASIFSAPASLAFAKLFYPETERSKTRFWNIVVYKGESSSCMDAIVTGATNGMALILKLSGNLIGFISFISFINFLPGWFGGLVGLDFLSAEWILSKIFWPVAYLIGVKENDCNSVAWLVAVNTLFTNMAGYKIMGDMKIAKTLDPRSEMLVTFSICGFCNLSSFGLAYVTLDVLVPERRSEFSVVITRAMVGGICTCLITACVAGSLIKEINVSLPEFVFNETSDNVYPGYGSDLKSWIHNQLE